PLQAGIYAIAQSYDGDATHPARSDSLFELVYKVPTTTTLTSSQNPTLTSGAPTITATVTSSTGASPTGGVVFSVTRPNGSVAGTFQFLSSLGTASISLPDSPLQAGTYTISAQYSDSSIVFADSADTFYELVNNASAVATSTHLGASPSVVTAGQTISFTATVAPVGSATAAPTGSVSFVDHGTIIGTGTLATGQAT